MEIPTTQAVTELWTSQPLVLLLVGTLVMLFALSALRRLLRIAVVLAVLVGGYVGYLYFAGEPIPSARELVADTKGAVRTADELTRGPLTAVAAKAESLAVNHGDKVLDVLREEQSRSVRRFGNRAK